MFFIVLFHPIINEKDKWEAFEYDETNI